MMKKRLEILTIVSLMTFCSFSLNAQRLDTVLDAVESLVKSKKAVWTLERKERKGNIAHLKWTTKKKRVDASVTETNSTEEATELLRQTAMRIPVPPKAKLDGYGDEAYLYKSDGSDASTILIRQDTLFIFISASHFNHAKEFAKDICGIAKDVKNAQK